MLRKKINNSKEIINIIHKINESLKMKLLVSIILSSIVIFLFIIFYRVIDKNKFREYIISDNINLINSIESFRTEDNSIILEGYAFMSGRDSINSSISLFLRNSHNHEELWLDINQINRPDVETYFGGEYYYGNSGFKAVTKAGKLDKDEIYEVILNIDYTKDFSKSRTTVTTNKFILNNKLYSYNPMEFEQPDMNIKSELLKELFINGRLCFYQKEAGMYVYQYKGKLYWVAENNFDFNENGSTYITYHLYTTQIDKLPENRIKYNFDNLDFYFEQYEYSDEITAPYRVAICDIPDDYAVANIKTGLYDKVNKSMIWYQRFHLDGLFDR